MSADRWSHGAVVAEYATADQHERAMERLRALGYRALDAYTPYADPRELGSTDGQRSWLPWLALAAGIAGAVLGYAVQWYANVWVYPQNAGGRPPHAVPAFVLPTVLTMLLTAAVATFVGMLVSLRLPRLWQPVFEMAGFERSSADRFFLAVGEHDARFDVVGTRALLEELGAVRVARVRAP